MSRNTGGMFRSISLRKAPHVPRREGGYQGGGGEERKENDWKAENWSGGKGRGGRVKEEKKEDGEKVEEKRGAIINHGGTKTSSPLKQFLNLSVFLSVCLSI